MKCLFPSGRLPHSPCLTLPGLPALLTQWNAKVYETKASCQQVYNAARPVLAAIHDAPLDG